MLLKNFNCVITISCTILMISLVQLLIPNQTVNALTNAEQDVNSYNPTEPEKQLGKLKTIDIDESGSVYLNKNSVQGSLNKNGDVYIETVKRPKVFAFDDADSLKIYYFLDKDGDIFSMKLNQHKYLEDKEGNRVLLKLVKSLEGRNGVADKDGFKSNLVPEKFLPKTSLDIHTVAKDLDDLEGTGKQHQHQVLLLDILTVICISVPLIFFGIVSTKEFEKEEKEKNKNN